MSRPKGLPKSGGRKAGTPNKLTSAIHAALESLDPGGKAWAQQIHELACGRHADPHVRVKALALGAQYRWERAVERHEHSGPSGQPIPFTWLPPHPS